MIDSADRFQKCCFNFPRGCYLKYSSHQLQHFDKYKEESTSVYPVHSMQVAFKLRYSLKIRYSNTDNIKVQVQWRWLSRWKRNWRSFRNTAYKSIIPIIPMSSFSSCIILTINQLILPKCLILVR